MVRVTRLVLLLTLLASLSAAFSACSSEEARPFAGTRRTPAPNLTATLPDVGGESFHFVAGKDQVLIVYFGYTSCPDVCPTTMADVRVARNGLDDDGDRVQVAMVTVDPGRDSDTVLSSYVNSFVPGSTALRTEDDDMLAAAAAEFGVFYEVTTLDDGSIEVAHSGTLFAVDDQGTLTASWPFGTPSSDLQNDLSILLSETKEANT